MAKYIKANSMVAEFLGVEKVRVKTKDNCYLLWQADMLAFGPLTQLEESAAAIGAIVLTPREAKTEQDGIILRELPTATDERFIAQSVRDNAEEVSATDSEQLQEEAESVEPDTVEGATVNE
jgi:hypothetical protein